MITMGVVGFMSYRVKMTTILQKRGTDALIESFAKEILTDGVGVWSVTPASNTSHKPLWVRMTTGAFFNPYPL